ncbi:MAG: manganese efflux pump MntP family protein [Spirochaetes bacterium]|nr:manganese efflux pump MntP family protein [Spirochaetota bacterium]
MKTITVILIAIGLSMDAFAVSIANGITITRERIPNALKIAFSFGLFQAVMPVIGWLAGRTLVNFVSSIDHWIAFVLLSYIGAKMIYEAVKSGRCETEAKDCSGIDISQLFILSVATSIDALAVGITFAFLKISIIYPVIIIGVITFAFSFVGFFAGNRLGLLFGNKIEMFGGFILIGIGLKILIEHLFLN